MYIRASLLVSVVQRYRGLVDVTSVA